MITKIINNVPHHFENKNILGKIVRKTDDAVYAESFYFYLVKASKSETKKNKNDELKNEYVDNGNNHPVMYIDESIEGVTPEQIEAFQNIANMMAKAIQEVYNPDDDAATTALKLEDFFNIEKDNEKNEVIETNILYVSHDVYNKEILFRIENKKDLEDFFEDFVSKLYITGRTLDNYDYSYVVAEYNIDKNVKYNDFTEYIASKI